MSESRENRLERIRAAADPGKLWDLDGYDIDRADVEWVISDAVRSGAAVGALAELVKQYDDALSRDTDIHAQVAMDTREDAALHANAVETLRKYQASLRGAFATIATRDLGDPS